MDESFWEEIERAKSLTAEQKFLATIELFVMSRELVASGIREASPEASDQEVENRVRDRYKLARESELLF